MARLFLAILLVSSQTWAVDQFSRPYPDLFHRCVAALSRVYLGSSLQEVAALDRLGRSKPAHLLLAQKMGFSGMGERAFGVQVVEYRIEQVLSSFTTQQILNLMMNSTRYRASDLRAQVFQGKILSDIAMRLNVNLNELHGVNLEDHRHRLEQLVRDEFALGYEMFHREFSGSTSFIQLIRVPEKVLSWDHFYNAVAQYKAERQGINTEIDFVSNGHSVPIAFLPGSDQNSLQVRGKITAHLDEDFANPGFHLAYWASIRNFAVSDYHVIDMRILRTENSPEAIIHYTATLRLPTSRNPVVRIPTRKDLKVSEQSALRYLQEFSNVNYNESRLRTGMYYLAHVDASVSRETLDRVLQMLEQVATTGVLPTKRIVSEALKTQAHSTLWELMKRQLVPTGNQEE